MSISLRSVELSNIRHHKHFMFKPADTGVTTIRGATGAGKSSIVDSVAWTLFGTKPRGVTKNSAIMRDQATWGEDKFYARITLNVDDTVMRVERRIVSKTGTVECDVWETPQNTYTGDDSAFTDDTHKAGASVTSAESYIRSRLKMDAKGFLAAVLVQQKQVDSLVTASPTERAQVIEKLTGISAVTLALKKAREVSSEHKKTLASTNVDEKRSVELHQQADALNKEITALTDSLSKQEKRCQDARTKHKEAEQKYTHLSDLYEQQETKVRKVNENTALIKSLQADLPDIINQKKALKSTMRAAAGTSVPPAAKVRQEMIDAQSSLSTARSRQADLANSIATWESEAQQVSDTMTMTGATTIQETEQAKAEHTAKVEDLKAQSHQHVADGKALETEIAKLRKAITALTDGEGTCPTCLQKVDAINTVLAKLNQDVSDAEQKIEHYRDLYRQTATAIKDETSQIEALNEAIKAIHDQETLTQQISQAKVQVTSLSGQVRALEAQVESTRKVLATAEENETQKTRYDELAARGLHISDRIESLEKELDDIKNTTSGVPNVTLKKLTTLRGKVDTLATKAHEADMRRLETQSQISVAQERSRSIQVQAQQVGAEIAKYKDMLTQVEEAVTTTNVVERFRETRIEDSVPVIEEYASDLISRFTSGKFVRLEMDKKFNATVVLADGRRRPVGMLSGGEMSAAAIALRVAISMLLNQGTSQNLIILDEVLVSQDYTRAEAIIETIREICKGQIVLIAHNDSIDAHSDKVVEITP